MTGIYKQYGGIKSLYFLQFSLCSQDSMTLTLKFRQFKEHLWPFGRDIQQSENVFIQWKTIRLGYKSNNLGSHQDLDTG